MDSDTPHCANCGAPLATADAICPRCELEFTATRLDPTVGKYRCPGCGNRFDTAQQALWPQDVPWYRPQQLMPQCPHCKQVLRDRRELRLSTREMVVFVAIAVLLILLPGRPYTQWAFLAVILAIVGWRRAHLSIRSEEERYTLAKDV
jgi:predicted amidophosphoribosyltransferase